MQNIFTRDFGIRLLVSDVADSLQDTDNLLNPKANCPPGLVFAPFVKPPVSLLLLFPRMVSVDFLVVEPFQRRHAARKVSLHAAGNWIMSGNEVVTDEEIWEHMRTTKPVSVVDVTEERSRDPICFRLCPLSTPLPNSVSCTRHHAAQSKLGTESGQTKSYRVRCLLLRILATHKSTLPCINGLQLWSVSERVDTPQDLVTASTSVDVAKEPQPSQLEDTSGVPEEFLDPITLTVMLRPVLLPSGNYIDRSTLDRYWGHRRPHQPLMDPFTLVPVRDPASLEVDFFLSSRIQSFLTSQTCASSRQSQDAVKTALPQILGSGRGNPTVAKRKTEPLSAPHSPISDDDDLDLATQRVMTQFPWLVAAKQPRLSASCEFCGVLLDCLRRGTPVYRVRGCGTQLCAKCPQKVLQGPCPACKLRHSASQIHRIHDNIPS